MISKIEVYVRNEEVVIGDAYIGRPIVDHWCTFKETLKTEKVMSEADRITLEVINEIAKEKNLEIEVCDISSFKGKLKARSKGITKTPTIIIGDKKIEGIQEKEQILNLLR
jgi:protein-disulfide isomerase